MFTLENPVRQFSNVRIIIICMIENIYRKTCNIRCTLVGIKIVDHSDVVGAVPVGPAPTTSSFLT